MSTADCSNGTTWSYMYNNSFNCGNESNSSAASSANSIALSVVKATLMTIIILLALAGNALVIAAVLKFRRLRIVVTNAFIVSLACADFLVALLVMPFNAMQIVGGRWPLGRILCNVFNSNDVFFSTASTLHLCCIGTDRYIAIMDPFEYERRMSRRRVSLMICFSWLASLLISYIPVHTGIYTTKENLLESRLNPTLCVFEVNRVYALISSTVSFWIPCVTMTFVYARIYGEAHKQEKEIYKMQKLVQNAETGCSAKPLLDANSCAPSSSGQAQHLQQQQQQHPNPRSEPSTPSNQRDRRRMKREHKAAKTLGIIMGCFIACWVPFFIWYTVTQAVCRSCTYPEVLVEILFWIGYFNSSLNPLIYAFFNREFRHAFNKLLRLDRLCGRSFNGRRAGGLNGGDPFTQGCRIGGGGGGGGGTGGTLGHKYSIADSHL